MPSARRRLPPLLLSCAALLAAASGAAQDTARTAPAKFTGLPETGQPDDSKVLQARYGKAQAAPAAGLPGSGEANVPAAGPGPGPQAAIDFKAGIAGAITGVLVDAGETRDKLLPLTFGQVFAPGDLARGAGLSGRLPDGSTVPLQLDVKATHADGSARHAVISAALPAGAGNRQLLTLVRDKPAARPAGGAAASLAALLESGFTAAVSATIDGQVYGASAEQLLRRTPAVWLDGPLVTEWVVQAPLTNAKGAAHPRLSAQFAVRWYPTLGKARVDVTVENTWTYQPTPQNITYDARVQVGGKEVYARPNLTHLNQARWRKVFWWGEAPAIQVRHDTAYLIASRALPNYDQSLAISGAALAELGTAWSGPKTEPMGIGLAMAYMPTTGGRPDIGLLPAWAALYLLSMDPRAKTATLGTAELAGSWSMHYRDQRTGRPVSLVDYPYMTILGHDGDTRNPKTGKLEAFPRCRADACATPYTYDVAHQPNFAYLPYLVTGDFYFLEELEFWAMFDVFNSNPAYRENVKGLLKPEQVRGQGWGLRTLGEAAYIVPDADPLKPDFLRILKSNLDWYNAEYTNNRSANRLGFVANGNALAYEKGNGLAPWQDDFFTAAIGHLAELGFGDAGPLLAWKAKFPILRMTAPGACWVSAPVYNLIVRDSQTSPFYTSMEQAYKASLPPEVAALPCGSGAMAQALKIKPGEMTGYSLSPIGYPSNMQPALAYAADAGGAPGREAWRRFMARSVKPDYGTAPQFAIVPRKAAE